MKIDKAQARKNRLVIKPGGFVSIIKQETAIF